MLKFSIVSSHGRQHAKIDYRILNCHAFHTFNTRLILICYTLNYPTSRDQHWFFRFKTSKPKRSIESLIIKVNIKELGQNSINFNSTNYITSNSIKTIDNFEEVRTNTLISQRLFLPIVQLLKLELYLIKCRQLRSHEQVSKNDNW